MPFIDQAIIVFNDATKTFLPSSTLVIMTVQNKTSAYTAVAGDFVKCDTSAGGFTVLLPLSSANSGKTIVVKKVSSDTNVLTIGTSGSDTIDGQATQTTAIPQTAVEVTADGTTVWEIS